LVVRDLQGGPKYSNFITVEKMITETNIPGWSTGNELGLLGSLASRVEAGGHIVELGSFAGRTAYIIAKNAPQATVHCVDPWGHFDISWVPDDSVVYMSGNLRSFHPGELYDFFLSNVADCPNVNPIRALSTEAAWDTQAQVDLLFIDADHETEPLLADMRTWWPRLKRDGMMVGHDWQMETVRKAVLQFLGELNQQEQFPQLINFPTTSIWGLLLGVDHAAKWGMDFSSLYPCGDGNFKPPRELDAVKADVAAALRKG
jgi:hypothetical protein